MPHLGIVFHHPVGHCNERSVRYRMRRRFWIFKLARAEVFEGVDEIKASIKSKLVIKQVSKGVDKNERLIASIKFCLVISCNI